MSKQMSVEDAMVTATVTNRVPSAHEQAEDDGRARRRGY